jgi:AraC-like DNA-binding protein
MADMGPGQGIERIAYSRPAALPGIEILVAEDCSRLWRVYHETYTVCTALDTGAGGAEWMYRRKTHFAATGGLMLMEPGELHVNTRVRCVASFRVLFIDPSLVECAAKELGMAPATPHLRVAQLYDPMLFRTFARLHACLERDSTTLERQSRFAACMRRLLEHCAETGSGPIPPPCERAALHQARAFIHDHYADSVALNEVAAAAGLSRFHLARAFAAEFGLPPHAYQIRVRIERACGLLVAGMPPAEVAAAAGFADQSHLTRHFKQVLGVTPGQYVGGERGGWPSRIAITF